jgi:hypothetical protein
MSLSWNEIKTRASAFVLEWKDKAREEADAKTFEAGFLNIFGDEGCKKETTRKLAEFPTLFGEIRQPNTDYIQELMIKCNMISGKIVNEVWRER